MKPKVTRRDFARLVGTAGVVSLVPTAGARNANAQGGHTATDPTSAIRGTAGTAVQAWDETLFFFNDPEGQFIQAAVDRLIPDEPEWAGAARAGVLYYIDRQLAGAYGSGAKLYLDGPWAEEAPTQQSYQLRYTPAELYRRGIAASRDACRGLFGREFWQIAPEQQDRFLTDVETGSANLGDIPGPVFFETLLANTIEGYFADPAYGGNRDMVSWRMLGFPGAYAQYLTLVDQHGIAYDRRPISIANQVARAQHISGHGEH